MGKIVKCKKCGAEIRPDEATCTYCGWMVYENAEKKYFEELEDIREDVEELELVPQQETKKSLMKIVRGIVIFIILFMMVCIVNYWWVNR